MAMDELKATEIRILTGPGGNFIGSRLFIDGKEIKNVISISISGSVESFPGWKINIEAPVSFTMTPEQPQQSVVGEIGVDGKPKFHRLQEKPVD